MTRQNEKNHANPSERDNTDGTKGFNPKLGGHGKADHAHTSGFDAEMPNIPAYTPGKESVPAGLEEGGRKRQPTTSAVVRPSKK